ncbi:MAG: fatty acid desaturase, partial [Planctomycetales bacterium]|nr:fatty acid desaturase [Planctomycetales bacterium]
TRLVLEWLVLVAGWSALLLLVHRTNRWDWLWVGHLAPAWIAGTVQTLRKFIEHLGRFGDNIYEMTRTVAYTSLLGRLASLSQLHVEHHGTHHRWPRVPIRNLPRATRIIQQEDPRCSVFPNHWAAFVDMLPHLIDPRVGPQWPHER